MSQVLEGHSYWDRVCQPSGLWHRWGDGELLDSASAPRPPHLLSLNDFSCLGLGPWGWVGPSSPKQHFLGNGQGLLPWHATCPVTQGSWFECLLLLFVFLIKKIFFP